MTRSRQRGFTLLEVMLALSLLGLGLTVLIKSAANSIFSAEESHMMGVATDLARGKMYDVEEVLLKDGYTDTDQSICDKDFSDEGWPNIKWCAKVDEVKMPDYSELQAMAEHQAKAAAGSGAGSGSGLGFGSGSGSGFGSGDALGGFENSALGGMLGMMGAFGGGKSPSSGIMGAQGGSLIQTQYSMFQQILKVSIRKVTLTVTWQVLGRDRDMKVVAFFTDAAAMDKVLNGMGSQDLDDAAGAGSGSGKGSGSGSGSSSSGGSRPTGGRGGTGSGGK